MIIAYPPLYVKFTSVHKDMPPLIHEKKLAGNVHIEYCHLIKVLAYHCGFRYHYS